jgi:hypothetical protein
MTSVWSSCVFVTEEVNSESTMRIEEGALGAEAFDADLVWSRPSFASGRGPNLVGLAGPRSHWLQEEVAATSKRHALHQPR